jgi:DNA-binding transcriptional LysR family regulator
MVARALGWESMIGRRVRLRDLHVLFEVVQRGSMAKAANYLGITQSAVSQVIADLEHLLGVRLLDRSSRGVEATVYGDALLKHGKAAFDDLRQGIQEIEFLKDPGVGHIRIGAPESIASGVLPMIMQEFSRMYSRANLDVETIPSEGVLPKLRDRSLDLVIVLGGTTTEEIKLATDLKTEVLMNDKLVVVADARGAWARRRRIDLAELVGAPWVLAPSGFSNDLLFDAFRAHGLEMPKVLLRTFSIHIRCSLTVSGPYLTTLPGSVLHFYSDRLLLKALPVLLPERPWPLQMVTLKNRTLSPLVQRFIECAHKAVRLLSKAYR